MKTISGFVLTNILGWRISGEFPAIKKSIVIFAPHTSYFDALYGKLVINEIGINHKFLSKKELFKFPMNIPMKLYGSIPVRGVKGNNAIYQIVKMLEKDPSIHIILSPEGTIAKIFQWNMGFYYMALKANVPIIVAYLDYQKKEVGIKGMIENLDDRNAVIKQINFMYKDVVGKYPENFSLNLRN